MKKAPEGASFTIELNRTSWLSHTWVGTIAGGTSATACAAPFIR